MERPKSQSIVATFITLLSFLLTPLITIMSTTLDLLPPKPRTKILLAKDIFLSILGLIFGRLLPRLDPTPVNLTGKNAIITGSNSGIGLQIALDLARQGCTITLACRTQSKAQTAIETIHAQIPSSKGRVKFLPLDTSSLDSVTAFHRMWTTQPSSPASKQIDILVHNAGISSAPPGSRLTPDGLETTYATNFLGSFLLTHNLEPHLSSTARVVFTSSAGQYSGKFSGDFSTTSVRGVVEPGFHCARSIVPILGWEKVNRSGPSKYGNTKSMQCAFARMLQKRWDGEWVRNEKLGDIVWVDHESRDAVETKRGRTVHCFTPGFTMTPIFDKTTVQDLRQDFAFALLKASSSIAVDVDQGAATAVWLASTLDERVCGVGGGGGYWDRMNRRMCTADTFDDGLLQRLWERWEADAGVKWRPYGLENGC